MLEVSQIHNSPTPTHHPTNPVNSKNSKYPTRESREKMRNPVLTLISRIMQAATAPPYCGSAGLLAITPKHKIHAHDWTVEAVTATP